MNHKYVFCFKLHVNVYSKTYNLRMLMSYLMFQYCVNLLLFLNLDRPELYIHHDKSIEHFFSFVILTINQCMLQSYTLKMGVPRVKNISTFVNNTNIVLYVVFLLAYYKKND